MADNVVFLEPGDERAQKIAKAMGSQTASDILQILGEEPRSLTDITERLNIPMNTAKYHIENLLDAGLIAVAQTKYSIKGREVKIYTLTNQLLVVAPRQSNVRTLLLKYASLFGIVAVCSVMISVLSPLFGPGSLWQREQHEFSTAGCLQGRWRCRCQSGYRDGSPECHHNARGGDDRHKKCCGYLGGECHTGTGVNSVTDADAARTCHSAGFPGRRRRYRIPVS